MRIALDAVNDYCYASNPSVHLYEHHTETKHEIRQLAYDNNENSFLMLSKMVMEKVAVVKRYLLAIQLIRLEIMSFCEAKLYHECADVDL